MRDNLAFLKKLLVFLKYLKPYWVELIITYLLSFLIIGINLITPLIIMALIDSLKLGMNYWVIVLLLLLNILLSLFTVIFQYLEQLLTQYCNGYIILNIKNDLYKHILKLPMWFFSKESPAQLLNRVNNDAGAFTTFINGTLKKTIINIFNVLGILLIARNIGSEYIVIVIIATLIFYFVTFRFSKYQRVLEKTNSKARGNIYNIMMESLSSIDIVKAYLMENHESNKFYQSSIDLINISLNSLRIRYKRITLNQIVDLMLFSFIYGYGGYNVIIGRITIGGLIAITQYTQQLRSGLNSFGSQYEGIAAALGQIERVIEIFNISIESSCNTGDMIIPHRIEGYIAFDQVSFGYNKEEYIIENATFEINKGEKVLITGSSGIGKTTIINLLLRYHNPNSGFISVDSQNIHSLELQSYRDIFGVVLQEMKIFSGTINDNIRYGVEYATDDEIIEAAKIARINDFIEKLPDKYNTQISSNFTNLSGGQKQRIYLARAILKNPPILIFDEAFNALDLETDTAIKKSIETVFNKRTCIIIAHDNISYNFADKTYRIEGKKLNLLRKRII